MFSYFIKRSKLFIISVEANKKSDILDKQGEPKQCMSSADSSYSLQDTFQQIFSFNCLTSVWQIRHDCNNNNNVHSPEGREVNRSLMSLFERRGRGEGGDGWVRASGSWRPTGTIHINTTCHWLINIANKWRLPRQGSGVHAVSPVKSV